MRSLSKLVSLFPKFTFMVFIASLAAVSVSAQQQPAGRVVLVLPFDNHSGNTSLNWIGDSFPDTLNKRLSSAGFLTISRDDRAYAFDHLGLPAGFRPSRATTIRIAQQLDANFVVIGSYTVLGKSDASSSERISIQSQVLSIDQLKLTPPVDDTSDLNRLFDAENAIAWKVARILDPQFPVAVQTFLAASGGVSLPAFEDYIRGATAATPSERLKRLQAAVTLAPGYSDALLALGKAQYADRDFESAAATLAKVSSTDRLALEANFYLGLSRFNSADYTGAQKAFHFLASRLPLPEVVNDEGVAISRQGTDATALFQRAAADDPSDEDYHYNLAVSLFRRGDTANALQQADAALKLKPSDSEAGTLRARISLSPAGTSLVPDPNGFSPVERIRREYSEAGFRQAAFQLDQLRAVRLATLSPEKRAAEYTQLGSDYLVQGLLPEAETQFQAALNAEPNSAEAHAGLARIRESSGSPAKARDEANTSIILKPNVQAYMVLARLDLAAQKLPAAADDIAHALQLEPNNASAIALRMAIQQRSTQTVP